MKNDTKNAIIGGAVGGLVWVIVRRFWENYKFKKEIHRSLDEIEYRIRFSRL